MKRTLFLVICAATLAASCQKEQSGLIETDKTPVTTLTFKASLPETKVAVNTTSGKVTWVSGDSFAFFNTDGIKFEATLSAGEGTSEGTFTCTSFTGTLDSSAPAVYPFAYAGAAGKVVIPHYMAWAEGVPAIMASDVSLSGENVIVDFTHLMSILEITLQDVPAYARAVKFSSAEGQKLSGTYTVNATKDGVTLDSGLSEQVIYFPYKTAYGADATIKICAPIPAYTYTDLYVSVLDGDEDALEGTTKKVKSSSSDLAVADYRYMPTLNVRSLVGTSRDKYVKVEGVKWAKGNLRYWGAAGNTSGWQDGWNVYDEQWKTQYAIANPAYNKGANATAKTFNLTDASYVVAESPDHWDYFAWGQLGAESRYNVNILKSTSPNMEMGGVLRYDTVGPDVNKYLEWTSMTSVAGLSSSEIFSADAKVTISENTYSLYGDVAYWASKGQYRTPNKAEVTTLTTAAETHQQAGYYVTASEGRVYGNLYRTCASWESASDNTTAVALTDADLESGVFIPKVGVAYTGADTYDGVKVQQYNNWSVYRSSTYSETVGYPHATFAFACGGANSVTLYNYSQTLGGAKIGRTNYGEPIRPVYIGE